MSIRSVTQCIPEEKNDIVARYDSRINSLEKQEEQDSSLNSSDDGKLDDPDSFPEGGTRANLTVVGSFIGLIATLGFINGTGVIQQYISENILRNVSQSSVGWIFSVYNFMAFGGTLVVGPIFDGVGARIPLGVGIVMQIIGFVVMSFCSKIWQFILGYSILGGIGCSLTYGPYVGVVSHHFLKRRGFAIGIAYVGGAVGGIVFPIAFRLLFPKVGFGWTIRIGALMSLVFHAIGFALVTDRRKEINANRRKLGLEEEDSTHIVAKIVKSIDFMVFKDLVYTCLVFALIGNGFAFLISLTYIPAYATANGMKQSTASLLVVLFNGLSIPGRLIPSYLADIWGRFNMLCVVGITSTLAFAIIWLPPPIGHTRVGIYLFSAIYGFTSGSILSLAPACVGQICHTKDFGKRYGTAYFALSFADLLGIPIGGAFIGSNTYSVKGYDNMVIFITVLSAIGTIAAFVARYLHGGLKWVIV